MLGVWLMFYLLAAFVAWDFNAGHWSGDARYLLACLSLGGGVFAWFAAEKEN